MSRCCVEWQRRETGGGLAHQVPIPLQLTIRDHSLCGVAPLRSKAVLNSSPRRTPTIVLMPSAVIIWTEQRSFPSSRLLLISDRRINTIARGTGAVISVGGGRTSASCTVDNADHTATAMLVALAYGDIKKSFGISFGL
jgi:hypothetical protein